MRCLQRLIAGLILAATTTATATETDSHAVLRTSRPDGALQRRWADVLPKPGPLTDPWGRTLLWPCGSLHLQGVQSPGSNPGPAARRSLNRSAASSWPRPLGWLSCSDTRKSYGACSK